MRNYGLEAQNRVQFIKDLLNRTGASGIVYGNSGGKDCTLVSILCRKATENILGVIMPCGSSQNYGSDLSDAEECARKYDIKNIIVDLTDVKNELVKSMSLNISITDSANSNIQPRLRMTALYAIAHTNNYLVAGTGNRSERHMGYFTKYGDGGCDFNVISDLTVTEIYEFLEFLDAPKSIINKKPSAGLYEGQTDEAEMGVSYDEIDELLLKGSTNERAAKIIGRHHESSHHKRVMPVTYENNHKDESDERN